MIKAKQGFIVYGLILLVALSFRFSVAHFLPNDDPDDGKMYAQMARNLLEQHVFSHATEPPYEPSLIRLPGYPLLLAGIYAIAGHTNNSAVREFQALVDTATCALVALVAFYWEPDPERKRAASIGALILAAICPFTTIYVATILTETVTSFLAVAITLAATLAFMALNRKKAILWWMLCGLLAGLAVLFRPDSGLFAAAVGITLVISSIFGPTPAASANGKAPKLFRAVYLGLVFSIAFCVVLLPWTIRNERVFHLFQPLAPAHAEMPGEFVPHGYLLWLRTWLDDEREIEPFLWSLDTSRINVDDVPAKAFDSPEEKQRVAALLNQYNHPPGTEAGSSVTNSAPDQSTESKSQPEQAQSQASPSTPQPSEESSEAGDDESSVSDSESNDENATTEETQDVAMTPEIDSGFAQIAHERISRSPFRYYAWLPMKRGAGLWFNTHSQYYPFEGPLFAPPDDEHDRSQQIWLPIFTALVWIYTFLGVVGAWFLWHSGEHSARRWLLLAALIIFLRLGFFSFLENPEPRYVVELFPFISILGGIALVRVIESFRAPLHADA